MNVIIPEKQKKFVEQNVQNGRFHSESDVISASLELLMDKARRDEEEKLNILRTEVQLGIDDIEAGRVIDGEESFEKARNIIKKIKNGKV